MEDEQDMLSTDGEIRTNSLARFSYELLYTDTPVLAHQQKLIFISSARTLDGV